MGARTRSFANLLNTDGTFLSGAINNSSLSSVTDLPTAASGALTLITASTASDDQYVTFTGIDSTYDTYLIKIVNAEGSSGTPRIMFQGSTDGGSNYGVTATTTMFQAYHNEADSGTGLIYETGTDEAQSTSNLFLGGDIDEDADASHCSELWLFNPSSTTYVKHFIHSSITKGNGDYAVSHFKGGYFNTTSAINALRFATSSGGGNISTGSFYLYGLK